VDVTDVIKPQGNQLEVDVVNLWTNRIHGDDQLYPYDSMVTPAAPEWVTKGLPRPTGRYTFYMWGKEHMPWLKPSGLLGPVRLLETN
jgi:hypothetical protein